MERREIDMYSEECNCGIVRMPGRRFPGCVVQGDDLASLLVAAERVHDLARDTGNVELIDESAELRDLLTSHLQHYERVLTEHGMSLPYYRQNRAET
jgi:hypothetical protein